MNVREDYEKILNSIEDPETVEAFLTIYPRVDYTEFEHQEAKLRFAMGKIHEELCDIDYYAKYHDLTKDQIMDRIKNLLWTESGDFHMPNGESQEDIDNWVNREWKPIQLGDAHIGDCTAVAASCMFCYYSQYYTRKFRAPKGKHSGWRMLHLVDKAVKDFYNEASALDKGSV